MRAEDVPAVDPECVLHVAGGVVFRDIQRVEVVIRVLDFRAVTQGEAQLPQHLQALPLHQVDRGINFAHLKGVLSYVARALYGKAAQFRFKPKFYPYTEPSIGLDIACTACGGRGCEACHSQGWVTIMGAGMIHPKILRQFGYARAGVRGIAFGWGTTRMTAQWLGLDRVKSLYEQDHRFFQRLNRRMDP